MNIDIDTVEVVAVLLLAQATYRGKEWPRNCSQCKKKILISTVAALTYFLGILNVFLKLYIACKGT